MMNFGLILSDTDKSFYYLKNLLKKRLIPNIVIIYTTNKKTSLYKILKNNNINFRQFYTNSINNLKIVDYILNIRTKLLIFSGYPGEIIKSKILDKTIIHSHPGLLPQFKGSTTFYYSIIKDKKIGCSVIKMNNKVDEGKILYQKTYKIPKKINSLENTYDYKIRIDCIIEYFNNKKEKKIKRIFKQKYSAYYIAHPIIRYIAINKRKIKSLYSNNL